jgi:1-deoxy-D-xylulose-5-phosphate reductoisomerase
MRKIALLGSTGSIGTQALNIIKNNKDSLKAELLSCNSRLDLIFEQIKEFNPKYVALPDIHEARKLAQEFNNITFFYGEKGLAQAALECEYDYMLNSLLGISGFIPTYNCLKSNRSVALANKETLVAGGNIIMGLAKEKGLNIIPVDSEHSAIFQCLQGGTNNIKKLTLTASGGPFRGRSREYLEAVTVANALNHPNWSMGAKITIDSATLMNKGFEVIEAKWLFDVTDSQIDVVVHPESIIHSMVEFDDNSTLAQLGQPDMAIPISYAFSYPGRLATTAGPIDLIKTSSLSFFEPDYDTFKCLRLAMESMAMGQSYSIVLNAANEVLVDLFLKEKIRFLEIGDTIEKVLDSHKPCLPHATSEVLQIDKEAREQTLNMLK